jgi:glycerophosphoryl diester phosphodiesterase
MFPSKVKCKKNYLVVIILLFFGITLCLFIPKIDRIVWRAVSIAEFSALKVLSKSASKHDHKSIASNYHIASHRGVFSENITDNSRKSIALAAQRGFRYIELDISFSKDFIPFIFHDSNLKSKTKYDKLTSEAYLKEIQSLTMSDGQKILTLTDFLSTYARLFKGIIFDLKTENNYFSEKANSFCNAIEKHDLSSEIYAIGRPCGVLTSIKRRNAKIKVGCEDQGILYNFITRKDLISLNYFTQYSHLEQYFGKKLDLTLILWTINDPEILRELDYLHNTIILTDLDLPLY